MSSSSLPSSRTGGSTSGSSNSISTPDIIIGSSPSASTRKTKSKLKMMQATSSSTTSNTPNPSAAARSSSKKSKVTPDSIISNKKTDNDDDNDDDATSLSVEPRLLFRGTGGTSFSSEQDESSSVLSSSSSTTTSSLLSKQRFNIEYHKLQRKFPILKKGQELFLRIPPRIRFGLVILGIVWKICITLFLIVVLVTGKSGSSTSSTGSSRLMGEGGRGGGYYYGNSTTQFVPRPPTRILYIVTTLAEYNTGHRSTIKGQDRLGEVLIPILVDSVENMITPFTAAVEDTTASSSSSSSVSSLDIYEVDVYLILGYELAPHREAEIRKRLPSGVGLQIWNDATPLGYDNRHSKDSLILNTRTLARQHRYVIRDKLEHYDLFLCFEDDMRLTRHHIQHFMAVSATLERLRQDAPVTVQDVPEQFDNPQKMKYFGPMTRRQLSRVIPGFIRVEVLVNETINGAQKRLDPIPLDYNFEEDHDHDGGDHHGPGTSMTTERHVDPTICCHVPKMSPNVGTPITPKPNDLVIWETNVRAFSLREFPPLPPQVEGSSTSAELSSSVLLDWAVLMLGPGKHLDRADMMGGYWSGREGAFGKDFPRPSGGSPELIAQQGGWMATQRQIARLNNHEKEEPLCLGSFLPPFDKPVYHGDGQASMNVEFWSGGYQFFTGVKGGCNMQRIISMHPDHFSKHLIYHVANNKQKQLVQSRMLRADHLFGQLNTVRKMAMRAKQKQILGGGRR